MMIFSRNCRRDGRDALLCVPACFRASVRLSDAVFVFADRLPSSFGTISFFVMNKSDKKVSENRVESSNVSSAPKYAKYEAFSKLLTVNRLTFIASKK